MTPVQKREVWHRITIQGDAWRFNKYAERAYEATLIAKERKVDGEQPS
jgi:hypothetical protein